MRTALYIIIALVVAAYLFVPSGWPVAPGRSRWQKWFGPEPRLPRTPNQPSPDAMQPLQSIRTGKVPAAELACPSGWVYADGQCQYRYSPPWKWPGYNRPI